MSSSVGRTIPTRKRCSRPSPRSTAADATASGSRATSRALRAHRAVASSIPAVPGRSATVCETTEPPLVEVEDQHLMRCHIPLDELRALQQKAAEARMRIRAAVLEETGGALSVQELELEAPRAGEVLVRLKASGVCHSDQNAIDGTAATRCPAVLGHEGAGVVEAVGEGVTGGRRRRSRHPVVGAVVRTVRRVHPRRTAALRGGLAGDGRRRAARRNDPSLARRRAGLPLLADLVVRRSLRRPRALVRA